MLLGQLIHALLMQMYGYLLLLFFKKVEVIIKIVKSRNNLLLYTYCPLISINHITGWNLNVIL